MCIIVRDFREHYNSGQRVWPIDEKSAWILAYSQRPAEEGGLGDYVLIKIVLAENIRTEPNIPPSSVEPQTPLEPPSSLDMVIPLPGQSAAPNDLDGDGLYEDLNGNGRADFSDIILFFEFFDWIVLNEPTSFFDYNRNGRIDLGDIQALQDLIQMAWE